MRAGDCVSVAAFGWADGGGAGGVRGYDDEPAAERGV